MGPACRQSDKKLVNLTNMWKAEGAASGKKPAHWLRNQGSQEFVGFLEKTLSIAKSQLIIIVKGKGKPQGTYAHWQIAPVSRLTSRT